MASSHWVTRQITFQVMENDEGMDQLRRQLLYSAPDGMYKVGKNGGVEMTIETLDSCVNGELVIGKKWGGPKSSPYSCNDEQRRKL